MLSDDDSDDDDDDDDEFEDCDAGVEHDDVAPSAEPGPESFALRKSRTMSHALINVDECVALSRAQCWIWWWYLEHAWHSVLLSRYSSTLFWPPCEANPSEAKHVRSPPAASTRIWTYLAIAISCGSCTMVSRASPHNTYYYGPCASRKSTCGITRHPNRGVSVVRWASSLPEEAALGEEGGDDPLALLDMLERQLRAGTLCVPSA